LVVFLPVFKCLTRPVASTARGGASEASLMGFSSVVSFQTRT
jgi:hypothetical protein